MATITFTINDSVIPRIAAAYGVPANQLKATIGADIKAKVMSHEEHQAAVAAQAAVDEAVNAQRTAQNAAKTNSESQIVIS